MKRVCLGINSGESNYCTSGGKPGGRQAAGRKGSVKEGKVMGDRRRKLGSFRNARRPCQNKSSSGRFQGRSALALGRGGSFGWSVGNSPTYDTKKIGERVVVNLAEGGS